MGDAVEKERLEIYRPGPTERQAAPLPTLGPAISFHQNGLVTMATQSEVASDDPSSLDSFR